jgi:acetylornithine deacetylase/succinyl-diaminopimelate desuccinylase-like protein
MISKELADSVLSAINTERLVETALALVEVPSPTRSAHDVANRLAEIIESAGLTVERPAADWPEAPAVVTRLKSGRPGRTLQFNGHLDTVHLPFVPPRREGGNLYGSGISDMKGGVAAALEAVRALSDSGALPAGGVLLTAHDHHEGPWGDKRQVKALIRDGYVGDAVLLPEYCASPLPIAGRGMAIFEIRIRRDGEPVHEVLRQMDQPLVVRVGAELVARLFALSDELGRNSDSDAGRESFFVGQIESGEIYNQSPVECLIRGTRRWTTPGDVERVETQFRELLAEHAKRSGARIELSYSVQGDAFRIALDDPAVEALQAAHQAVTGERLALGPKPFLDDGNWFCSLAGVPGLTHGPNAAGAHTVNECCPLSELVRVARVYALTALAYCPSEAVSREPLSST